MLCQRLECLARGNERSRTGDAHNFSSSARDKMADIRAQPRRGRERRRFKYADRSTQDGARMLALQSTETAMSPGARRRRYSAVIVQTLPSAQHHMLFRGRARYASRGDARALASGRDCGRATAKVCASDTPP
jgi:hypothetical protein